MMCKIEGNDRVAMMSERSVAFDRARTFITLLVVIHHSVVNFTYFGNGDRMRWLGFDAIVLFNDSFFMAFMFLISGLFVHRQPDAPGSGGLSAKARLAARDAVVDLDLRPDTDRLLCVVPALSYARHDGLQFLSLLVAYDHGRAVAVRTVVVSVGAARIRCHRGSGLVDGARILQAFGRLVFTLRKRPVTAFVAFLIVSVVSYLPMHLTFGDGAWFEPGHYPFPIQTSRILLYPAYFFTGVAIGVVSLRAGILAENGEIAKRWLVWLAMAVLFFGAMLLLIYAHHNWIENFASPPLWWRTAYGLAFAMFSAAMAFTVQATSLRLSGSSLRLLDAMQPQAYGIYLLHYVFIIWLQYVVYDPAFPAGIKAAIVFTGTLAGSWTLTVLLRKIPFVARMI